MDNKTLINKPRKILFYFAILSLIFCNVYSKKIYHQANENKNDKRNLQFSLNSIYYNLPYPANDITGTGDKLKDVPFRVLCKILACESKCCVGEIDNIRCGLLEDCLIYSDYSKIPGMICAIVIPIGVFIILVFLFVFLLKYKKYDWSVALCMCLGCLFILTIPVVIYYYFSRRNSAVTVSEKNKER